MYNSNKRKGLYKKPQARAKFTPPKREEPYPIEHNEITHYLKQFLTWSEIQGLTNQTINTRNSTLRRFIVWCDERSLEHPRDITKPILEGYQKHLFDYRKSNEEPLSFRTQYALLIPVKAFFKWLTRENHILYNPASELDLPKVTRGIPKNILSVAEVHRVLDLPDINCPYGLRDKAILELLYSSGIRRMEVVNLEIYDVDRGRETLLIKMGKGRKDRMLPLGKRALHWVEKYRLESRPLIINDHHEKHLFLTDYGEPFAKNRLSDLVKRYLYHAHIEKPGSCHLFRHAMATHMLDNGADIRFIQAMLGHSDLSTTEIYTRVSVEKLREIHAATHPAKLEE
jgi:integrase/recombinase XerD